MSYELRHGGHLISDDPALLDSAAIYHHLSEETYWARGETREIIENALRHSLCLGAYAPTGDQAGLARVVTDYATFAWLCDVFVLAPHRRQGLGKALVQAAISHPRLQTLRRFSLATRDAHGLYAQFGFTPLAAPETQMERRNPARAPKPSA